MFAFRRKWGFPLFVASALQGGELWAHATSQIHVLPSLLRFKNCTEITNMIVCDTCTDMHVFEHE